MKLKDANELLSMAPDSTTKSSKINKSLTQAQSVEIVRKGINREKSKLIEADGETLTPLAAKRVMQVLLNRKRIPEGAQL